jgi:hypothetical protein
MKIRLDELRERYVSCIADRTPRKRECCPSPEIFTSCLRGSASKKQKNRLLDHLTCCSYCLDEFQFVLATLRQEKKLNSEIDRRLSSQDSMSFSLRESFKLLLSRKKALTAALAAASLTIVAGGLYLILHEPLRFRTPMQSSIKLIQPVNQKVSKTSLFFRWREKDGADHYIVELFDETLYPLWKSPRLYGDTAQFPPQLANRLIPGRTYFWLVSGFTAQGQKVESPLKPFQIKK